MAAQTVPSYVPTNGLVGWWPFNGNANDESGNGNHGTVNGATLTNDRLGNTNKAFSFDGLNDGIIASDTNFPMGSSDRSISFWMKDESIGDYCSIPLRYGSHSPSNGCWILHSNLCNINYPNGTLRADFYNSGVWSNSTLANNQWRMVTMTLQNQICEIFLDTMSIGQGQVIANTISSTNKFYIGSDSLSLPNYFFWGSIDDIGIWNRALTQQEITTLYIGCQLSVTSQPASQTININNNAQLVVSSSDPNATFQWQTDLGVGFQNISNAGQYSGATNDTLTVSTVGLINNNQPFRCIVSSGPCSDTSAIAILTVNNDVGITEFQNSNLLTIFPNPAKEIITLKVDASLVGKQYNISDYSGKLILTGVIKEEKTNLTLSNLSAGLHTIAVDNNKYFFNIIKE